MWEAGWAGGAFRGRRMSGVREADRRRHPAVTSALAWGHRELGPTTVTPIRFLPIKQPVFLLVRPTMESGRGHGAAWGAGPRRHRRAGASRACPGSAWPWGRVGPAGQALGVWSRVSTETKEKFKKLTNMKSAVKAGWTVVAAPPVPQAPAAGQVQGPRGSSPQDHTLGTRAESSCGSGADPGPLPSRAPPDASPRAGPERMPGAPAGCPLGGSWCPILASGGAS